MCVVLQPDRLRETGELICRVCSSSAADQLIVKWQNDAEAVRCPICAAPFNVITRKHHCRLCGRVVCFLPPNSSASNIRQNGNGAARGPESENMAEAPLAPPLPTRTVRCSTFIIYDHLPDSRPSSPAPGFGLGLAEKSLASATPRQFNLLTSGILREVDLGDAAVPFNPSLSQRERDLLESALESKRADETKRGVRVCRDCLDTVMKRQKKVQPKRTEGWMRLYGLLKGMQTEIEQALAELSELRGATPATVQVVKRFSAARKLLLQNLASYDALAKRIRDLPPHPTTPTSPASKLIGPNNLPISSSQDRLQKAIFNRAMLFLGEKMGVVKGMGGLAVDEPPPPTDTVNGEGVIDLSASRNGAPHGNGKKPLNRKQSVRSQRDEEERMARLAVLYEWVRSIQLILHLPDVCNADGHAHFVRQTRGARRRVSGRCECQAAVRGRECTQGQLG